ncbi:MAG: N-acetyltransferase [Clostridia bacterium]|nr:N-acetyltransferase [Clostridia bacterium]
MLNIRDAVPGDAERLLTIYSHYVENTAVSFEYEVPSCDEFRRRIENTLRNYPFLVAEKDGVIEGYSYAGVFKDRPAYSHSCEVTIYLDWHERRQGIGRKLYEALEERLKEQGVTNLYACIGDPIEEDEFLTKDSERFHQSLGYGKVGVFHRCGYKFGRWYNMIWMEKIIGGQHDAEQGQR